MATSSSLTRTSSAASSSAPLITSSHPLAPLKAQEIKRVLRLWEVDPKLILDASTKKELIELAELHGITGAPDEWTLQKKKDERTRLQKLPDHFRELRIRHGKVTGDTGVPVSHPASPPGAVGAADEAAGRQTKTTGSERSKQPRASPPARMGANGGAISTEPNQGGRARGCTLPMTRSPPTRRGANGGATPPEPKQERTAPAAGRGAQGGTTPVVIRPDLVLSSNLLTKKMLIEREFQSNDFIEKIRREAMEAGGGGDDDDAWSEIGSDAGLGFGGGRAPRRSVQRLRAIFDAFDYDHSGAIEVHELDQILREMNIQGQDAQALLTEVDADGNGVLDFDEFVAIFNKPTSGLASAFAACGHFDAGGLFYFVSSRFGGSGGNTSGTGARVKSDLK